MRRWTITVVWRRLMSTCCRSTVLGEMEAGGGAEKEVLEGNAGGVGEAGARDDGDRGSGDRRREEGARC